MIVKLLGVMLTVGVLVLLFSPTTLPGTPVPTAMERAKRDIEVLCIGMRMYEQDNDSLPENLVDLKHDYLLPGVFVDPWGNEYSYVRDNTLTSNEREWRVWTFGKDGVKGGIDHAEDISSDTVCSFADTSI